MRTLPGKAAILTVISAAATLALSTSVALTDPFGHRSGAEVSVQAEDNRPRVDPGP
ncbi:hypothetical protein GCM10009716_10300 [Streptomyces sodiiphilus]|uniref:Uncharacterized protein n=1 Tax=Streptomyces sodiiphilus TaxID=226217 RepID=A0ABP5A3K2_9ACTN